MAYEFRTGVRKVLFGSVVLCVALISLNGTSANAQVSDPSQDLQRAFENARQRFGGSSSDPARDPAREGFDIDQRIREYYAPPYDPAVDPAVQERELQQRIIEDNLPGAVTRYGRVNTYGSDAPMISREDYQKMIDERMSSKNTVQLQPRSARSASTPLCDLELIKKKKQTEIYGCSVRLTENHFTNAQSNALAEMGVRPNLIAKNTHLLPISSHEVHTGVRSEIILRADALVMNIVWERYPYLEISIKELHERIEVALQKYFAKLDQQTLYISRQ